MTPDVVVCGAGPAGLALTAALCDLGVAVELVDPEPQRRWTNTYGAWLDELPPPEAAAVAHVHARAIAHGEGRSVLARPYATVDTAALQDWLAARCAAVVRTAGGVERWSQGADGGAVAHLGGGEVRSAPVVVDATGGPRGATRTAAAQTAVGVVLDAGLAGSDPDEAVFMDWRPDHGEHGGGPTFLYELHLGEGRTLLEETALAARPPVGDDVLERRLRARLTRRGIALRGDEDWERVRIPLTAPPAVAGAVPFGAAAGYVHPATGYSLATSLGRARPVAAAVAGALDGGADVARVAGRRAARPGSLRLARWLHGRGLEALLAMDPALVPGFFDAFLGADRARWGGFLAAEPDPVATARAMAGMAGRSSTPVRRALVLGALGLRRAG